MRHTMLSTDGMSISKGLLNANILPCHFQFRSTLIYLQVTANNSHYLIITELCTKTLLHLISISFSKRVFLAVLAYAKQVSS